ncbi:MAG: hypothetical protein AAGA30_13730, partial [Planctomycetota bacterium]
LESVVLKYRIHNQSLNGKHLATIRRNQRYAANCAVRRTNQEPQIELSEFSAMEQQQSFIQRLQEKMNVFAMYQYRKALLTCLDEHWSIGYARLGFAALCSPSLTLSRVARILRSYRKQDEIEHAFPGHPGSSRD